MAHPLPPDADAEALTRCQVLVVDDDEVIRETMVYLLEYAGYVVCAAAGGTQALERLRSSPGPMVVLLDLNMPGMDGTQLLRLVANETALATGHAYIVVTARQKTFPLDFAALLTNLSVPVLAKPFDIDHLLTLVAAAEQRLTPS